MAIWCMFSTAYAIYASAWVRLLLILWKLFRHYWKGHTRGLVIVEATFYELLSSRRSGLPFTRIRKLYRPLTCTHPLTRLGLVLLCYSELFGEAHQP